MATQLQVDECVPFELRTKPPAAALGRALEAAVPEAGVLQLRFGDRIAGVPLADPWSACCELLFQAELVREGRLDRFVIDAEPIFELAYAGDLLLCAFSREHVFAVRRDSFAASLEQLVEEMFSATACPRLMHVAAEWGAATMRALPYSCRFTDSMLT